MRRGLGGRIVGDVIGNRKLHGGDDQAVYADGVTIGFVYRTLLLQPESMPEVLAADALPEDVKKRARRRDTA